MQKDMEIVVHFVQQGRQICKMVSPFPKTLLWTFPLTDFKSLDLYIS